MSAVALAAISTTRNPGPRPIYTSQQFACSDTGQFACNDTGYFASSVHVGHNTDDNAANTVRICAGNLSTPSVARLSRETTTEAIHTGGSTYPEKKKTTINKATGGSNRPTATTTTVTTADSDATIHESVAKPGSVDATALHDVSGIWGI